MNNSGKNLHISAPLLQISWAAFHANQPLPNRENTLGRSSLLPLFQEEAASAAMICHAIDVITKAVDFLNQERVPVLACDQPLYAIAKKVQWNFRTVYSEKKLVVMFGGFHTELAALKALGSWIEYSGWTSVLVQAGMTTPGIADSFLKALHVSCTRHAHQVTAAVVYVLMEKAYYACREGVDERKEPNSFIKLTIMIFVRSLRKKNFQLYKDACQSLASWFFALDCTHYARWLPVYIRYMECLEKEIPAVATELKTGNFVVNKTNPAFFSLPNDEHEQNNKIVKGDRGAIGLTDSSTQLLRWMVSGPEISRIITDFELSQKIVRNTTKQEEQEHLLHHEQIEGVQNTF